MSKEEYAEETERYISCYRKGRKEERERIIKLIDEKIKKLDEMIFKLKNSKTENVYLERRDTTVSKIEMLDALENKKKGYEELKSRIKKMKNDSIKINVKLKWVFDKIYASFDDGKTWEAILEKK